MNVLVHRQALSETCRGRLNGSTVFYNPIMEFSRDLSVLALDCYGKSVSRGLKVLDAMTGCGVRGLRYAMEVHDANHVLLNDIRRSASELARKNVDRNKMGNRTEIACMDANLVLALHNAPDTRFDVIDLDPFGSPAPFLDSTVRAASNNAMIAFTATDMPPLCGVRPNAALRKYGGRPLRTEYCHEIGARLLITSLVSTAARHDLGIDVKLTHYADHYIRVYATAQHGGMHANQTLSKLGYITHCFHCSYREYSSELANIEPNCRICGQHYSFAGPLWLGNLYDKTFCRQMLNLVDTKELGKKNRVRRLLKKILEEIDTFPTYYRIDRLSDRFQTPTPKPEHVVEEIRKIGYSASLTHFHGYGVRTDAGPKILEEILRQLSKKACA